MRVQVRYLVLLGVPAHCVVLEPLMLPEAEHFTHTLFSVHLLLPVVAAPAAPSGPSTAFGERWARWQPAALTGIPVTFCFHRPGLAVLWWGEVLRGHVGPPPRPT